MSHSETFHTVGVSIWEFAYGIGGFIYLFLAIAVFGKGDVSEGIGLFILTILMELAAVLVTVPPNNPVVLQPLKLIDFHLLRWSAQQRLFTVVGALTSMLKTSAQLRLENLALRQQLAVLRRSAPKRLKLTPADGIFWVWLRRVWTDWKSTVPTRNLDRRANPRGKARSNNVTCARTC